MTRDEALPKMGRPRRERTEEEIAAQKERRRVQNHEYYLRFRASLTGEKLEQYLERRREYRRNMTEYQRERERARNRERDRERRQRLKEREQHD